MTVGASPTARSAMAVPDTPMGDNRECYNCEKKGHLSWNCSLFRNAGRGCRIRGGRGASRGGRNSRGGRGGCKGGRGTANLVAEESKIMTETDYSELEELRQFKQILDISSAAG